MDKCAVPSCTTRPGAKFFKPYTKAQLDHWRKILRITTIQFKICDQHFEDRFLRRKISGCTRDAYPTLFLSYLSVLGNHTCQACMKNTRNNGSEPYYEISEELQEVLLDVIGCELQLGLICATCLNYITEFLQYREKVKNNQELFTGASSACTESDTANEDDYEAPTNHVGTNFDEETAEVVIKKEKFEDDEKILAENEQAVNSIIKIEPIEDEEMIKTEPLETATITTVPSTSAKRPASDDQQNPTKYLKGGIKVVVSSAESSNVSKCQFCQEKFPSREEVIEHIKQKHVFKCQQCSLTFQYKISLMNHQAANHQPDESGQKESVNNCTICKKTFFTKEKLQEHMQTVHPKATDVIRKTRGRKKKTDPFSSRVLKSSEIIAGKKEKRK